MDMVQALQVAAAVAHSESLTGAGRALGLSTPSVSRILQELERDLGVMLFTRSTRRIALTDAGAVLLQRGEAILDELAAMREATQGAHLAPEGVLRVTSAVAFGTRKLAPVIPLFRARYPLLRVELSISNRRVDLIEENVDVAIRVGGATGLADSGIIARRIDAQRLIFVATPGFLARIGEPQNLADLDRHESVQFRIGTFGTVHELGTPGGTVAYRPSAGIIVDSPNAARQIVLTGACFGLLAQYLVAEDIAEGRLRQVLPDHTTEGLPIHAVYAARRFVPARVRTFVDFLAETFADG